MKIRLARRRPRPPPTGDSGAVPLASAAPGSPSLRRRERDRDRRRRSRRSGDAPTGSPRASLRTAPGRESRVFWPSTSISNSTRTRPRTPAPLSCTSTRRAASSASTWRLLDRQRHHQPGAVHSHTRVPVAALAARSAPSPPRSRATPPPPPPRAPPARSRTGSTFDPVSLQRSDGLSLSEAPTTRSASSRSRTATAGRDLDQHAAVHRASPARPAAWRRRPRR